MNLGSKNNCLNETWYGANGKEIQKASVRDHKRERRRAWRDTADNELQMP